MNVWLHGKAELDVWEFESAHVTTPRTHVVPGLTAAGKLRKGIKERHRLDVGPLKMMAALARSGATLSPDATVGFWRAAGAAARFQEACTRSGRTMVATAGLIGFPYSQCATLHLVDEAVLQAVATGELNLIAESIDAFRRAFQEHGEEDTEGARERATFADGTVYTSEFDPDLSFRAQ